MSNVDEQDFLDAVFARPEDKAAVLVYADWLEERGDQRADYLRTQMQYREEPSPKLRQRLIESYPDDHLSWVLSLEQKGVLEANLTDYEFGWWGTDIGPARPSGSTYEMYGFADLPPLPAGQLKGEFDWLRESAYGGKVYFAPAWKAFCNDVRLRGYYVPAAFETFMTARDLPLHVKSCIGNYFKEPEARETVEREDGLLVTFLADSQYCILWGILLPREPGRYAPVLCGDPVSLVPGIFDDDFDPRNYPEQRRDTVVAASQFEAFVYRYWIESEIWLAVNWEPMQRPLNAVEQAYVNHLQQV